jgi:hypothetical protein
MEALDLAPADAPAEGEAPGTETDAAEDGEEAGEGASEAPTRPPYTPWTGRVLRNPATIVGDSGEPLCVLTTDDAEVRVIDADEIRFRVRIPGCGSGEGWLQAGMLAR